MARLARYYNPKTGEEFDATVSDSLPPTIQVEMIDYADIRDTDPNIPPRPLIPITRNVVTCLFRYAYPVENPAEWLRSGNPIGGGFTLTSMGKTTEPLPFDASPEEIDAAVQSLHDER